MHQPESLTSLQVPFANALAFNDKILFFHNHGYAVIDNFLTLEELSSLSIGIENIISRRKKTNSPHLYGPEPDPFLSEPAFMELLKNPRLIPILESLLDCKHLSALQSLLYIKAPGTPGRDPHQENFYHHTHPGASITAWFAIDECTPENGGLYVYEGSHREPILPIREHKHRKLTETGNLGLKNDRGLPCVIPKGYQQIHLTASPGTLVLLHNQTIHGSGINHSITQFRKSHSACYLKAGAPFRKGDQANRRLIDIY